MRIVFIKKINDNKEWREYGKIFIGCWEECLLMSIYISVVIGEVMSVVIGVVMSVVIKGN